MVVVMTTNEAAIALGITSKKLGTILKRSGMRMRLPRRGVHYLLSDDDLEQVREWQQKQKADRALERALQASIRTAKESDATLGYAVNGLDLKGPSPALPLEYLNDPAWHDTFVRERRRRELRLLVLIKQSGLTTQGHVPRIVDLEDEY